MSAKEAEERLNAVVAEANARDAGEALMYDPDRDVHELAKEYGCEADIALPYELQMDLDGRGALDRYREMRGLLTELGLIPSHPPEEIRASRNGNTHVTLKLPMNLPPELRTLLQALLGSDLKREALNLCRIYRGTTSPIMLFKPKAPASAAEPEEEDLPF